MTFESKEKLSLKLKDLDRKNPHLIQSLLVCIGLLLSSCGSDYLLVGVDDHTEKKIRVSSKGYISHVSEHLYQAQKALHESNPQSRLSYDLSAFMLGLGIQGKVSLAGVAQARGQTRIRLYFKNDHSK